VNAYSVTADIDRWLLEPVVLADCSLVHGLMFFSQNCNRIYAVIPHIVSFYWQQSYTGRGAWCAGAVKYVKKYSPLPLLRFGNSIPLLTSSSPTRVSQA